MSIFWEVIVSVFLSKMCMYMCPTLNSFRDGAISIYSWKIFAKGLLCIVYNIGIYCSSDKVGIFYPVQYIIQNSTFNNHAFCNRERTCRGARLRASLLSFMLAISSIMWSHNLSRVSTFVLCTSLFIQPHKQKSKRAQYGLSEEQFWSLNPNSYTVK